MSYDIQTIPHFLDRTDVYLKNIYCNVKSFQYAFNFQTR